MSILDNFPSGLTPRPIQIEILNEIDKKIKSGAKKIIVSAPTGVGKSPMAINLAQHFENSFVVTASKSLQDQYSHDFSLLKPVKGKSNFACLKIMEKKRIKLDDISKAMQLHYTCEKGECIEKKNGKNTNCKFKPTIQEYESNSFDGTICPYYSQKYDALISPHSLWNYHAYFQIMKYNQKNYGGYLNRRISIFDEAHKIEDQIIQFVGINIYKRIIDECGLDITTYDLSDIDLVITLLDDIASHYAKEIAELKGSRLFERFPDYDRLQYLEGNYDRATKARIEILSDKENFIINEPKMDGDLFLSLDVKPLDISKYVKDFFQTPIQIFMSATIDKNSFCETMGIPPDEIEIIDTPNSPFPVENRKINFLNVCKLKFGAPNQDELKVIKKIDELLSSHNDERGLVLTSSLYRCNEIYNNLSAENKNRIRICHAQNPGGKTQDDILKEHAQSKNGVLLSSSLWEGVDLKDDLSRFQIIAKVPYPNYKEKRIAAKKAKYPLWYTSQTVTKLLQGFGRSIRSNQDWAVTYVLDSAVEYLLYSARNLVPKAYHDVLGWNDSKTKFRSFLEN
ncbi:ATP-dependent DNA helicase [Nitrosopumilus sp. b1]|uniref:helicase C-terminal domain-containing protein n=1 Tax=Nitrosopumilus sp. b1 TaxID=2109907 RepID=UPI002106D93A|nr:ATP-dependent DNA helicase [Nitrosopumilus sp. b1]